ncbi:NAD(P)-binding protein [Microthyrium microscopicum]|uniref:NAD(P)-binding protein n=1 Tax=Microthyrium microscopicum TaxID=703497 RepID=A0A6A6UWS4_9PEZI|nr:NAD(P)-binding protein [Microthyrium microscopicum]
MFLGDLFYEQYFLSLPEPTASFAQKTVIITGANSGLGKEAARHIARLGCPRLILAVRNIKAGEAAKQDIVSTTDVPESSISIWELDLSNFTSVKSFIKRASTELDRLDNLICNAGINKTSFSEAEGYEATITVNVLSTWLLATSLLPLLEKTSYHPIPTSWPHSQNAMSQQLKC